MTKKTILCIEDNEDNQRVVLRALRRQYQIVMMNSASELREYLTKSPVRPIIVLSDVNLGDVGEAEMYQHIISPIKNMWADMTIVAVTAMAKAPEGCDDCLAKPVTKESLNNMIEKWV